MGFKKIVVNDYLIGVGEVDGKGNITEDEYNLITEIIHNKPIAPEGFVYNLKDNSYEWELKEMHPNELTELDYETAYNELNNAIGGNDNE